MLLPMLIVLMALPTMAWLTSGRSVTARGPVLSARHTDFSAAITILPCTSPPTATDHDLAEDVMHSDRRYTGLEAGDTYEMRITIGNRTWHDKQFDVTVDNVSMRTTSGQRLPSELFWIGVPDSGTESVSYFAEIEPVLTENGWCYFPVTALDGLPAASVAALSSGDKLAVTLRVRLRADAYALGYTQEQLSGAVFRIGQVSIRDTTPKGGWEHTA